MTTFLRCVRIRDLVAMGVLAGGAAVLWAAGHGGWIAAWSGAVIAAGLAVDRRR